MEPNSLMFVVTVSVLVIYLTAYLLLRIYGRMMAILGITGYCAVVVTVFLQVQVWNVDLPWGSRLAISFFTELGIIVVAVIVMFIANEWPQKIVPAPVPTIPKQMGGGAIDITTAMHGGEKVIDITTAME